MSRAGRWRDAGRAAAGEAGLLAPGLVHEMRQPLTGVDAGLKLIAKELGAAVTGLEAWPLVVSQVTRLDETLRTYHDLMDPRREPDHPFAVEPIVRRAVDLLRFRLRRLGDRFSVTVEDAVPDAHGTPGALLHAATNLLVNAVDAIEDAGGSGRVEIRIRRTGGAPPRAQVRVADEGVGVPRSLRDRLFEPRVTTKAPGRGSGLGLAIARHMMRNARGEVCLVPDDDPDRRAWARTEFAIDLAAGEGDAAPRAAGVPGQAVARVRHAWTAIRTWVASRAAARRGAPPAAGGGPRAARNAVRAAALLAAVALLLGGGWVLLHRWTAAWGPSRQDAVLAGGASPKVVSIDGRLERRTGADAWIPVVPGERLGADDVIRTTDRSSASLAFGSSSLTVNERTQLAVREITAAVHRFKLSRGHVFGDYQADGARVLVIEDERGDSVARTHGARFSVLSTGAALAVETQAGVVRLQSGGAEVDVPAGRRSVAFRGVRPAAATPIPVDVLLRVAAAAAPPRSGICTVVRGKVDAGSEVTVEGVPVRIAEDGTFDVAVPRARGRREARVVTRDVAGRRAERFVPCGAASGPEVSEFAVRWHDGSR